MRSSVVSGLVLFSTLALAVSPSAEFESAIALKSPGKQRAAIVALVAKGDILAASRLLEIGLSDEMRTMPADSLAAWRASDDRIEGRLIRQVVAAIEANRASRTLGGSAKADALRGFREILRDPVPETVELLHELAWLESAAEPADEAASASRARRALELLDQSPPPTDPLIAANRAELRPSALRFALGDEAGCADAMPMYAEAAHRFAAIEDRLREARVLLSAAWCSTLVVSSAERWSEALRLATRAAELCPSKADLACSADAQWRIGRILEQRDNPERSPQRAAAAFLAAARGYEAIERHGAAAASFKGAAFLLQPDQNPDGSWSASIESYEKGAAHYAAVGIVRGQASSAHDEAWAWSTQRNPEGDNERAAALYGEAARLNESLGELALAADDLSSMSSSLRRVAGPVEIAPLIEISRRAVDLARRSGDHAVLAHALQQLALLVRQKENPGGSCEESLPVDEEAANEAALAGNLGIQALATTGIAHCLQPQFNPKVTDWSAAVVKGVEAVDLARRANDPFMEGHARNVLATALEPDVNPDGDVPRMVEELNLAAEAFARAVARNDGGLAVASLAYWTIPDRNPAGDWGTAAELYARAATLLHQSRDDWNETAVLGMRVYCLCRSGDPALQMQGLSEAPAIIKRRCLYDEADAISIAAVCPVVEGDPCASN